MKSGKMEKILDIHDLLPIMLVGILLWLGAKHHCIDRVNNSHACKIMSFILASSNHTRDSSARKIGNIREPISLDYVKHALKFY